MDTSEIEQLAVQLDCLLPQDAGPGQTKTSHRVCYKNEGRSIDQERRWRLELEKIIRKNKKQQKFDENRNLSPTSDKKCSETHHNNVVSKPKGYCGHSWRSFSMHLMLGEWFLFLPPTIEQDYLMKICPKGRHVMVRAAKGRTEIISRCGKRLFVTVSCLPGGGLGQSDAQNRNNSSTLDCIMHSETVDLFASPPSDPHLDLTGCVLYVLDLVHFRKTSYMDIPFRERCSWLETFLKDELEKTVEESQIQFKVIPSVPCDRQSMIDTFSTETSFEVDGILFYHGLVGYEPGATPLVAWMKPYMLTEWFPYLSVHPSYLKDVPVEYTTCIEEVQKQENARRLAPAKLSSK